MISTVYLDRELWEVLGTLLHELLHPGKIRVGAGKRNHHNAEFQARREVGLVIDSRGLTGYSASSPFKDLLGKRQVCFRARGLRPEGPPRGDRNTEM